MANIYDCWSVAVCCAQFKLFTYLLNIIVGIIFLLMANRHSIVV